VWCGFNLLKFVIMNWSTTKWKYELGCKQQPPETSQIKCQINLKSGWWWNLHAILIHSLIDNSTMSSPTNLTTTNECRESGTHNYYVLHSCICVIHFRICTPLWQDAFIPFWASGNEVAHRFGNRSNAPQQLDIRQHHCPGPRLIIQETVVLPEPHQQWRKA